MQTKQQVQQSLGSEEEYQDYEKFLYQEFLENQAAEHDEDQQLADQNTTAVPTSEAAKPDWRRCYVVPMRQRTGFNDPPGPVHYDGEVHWKDGRPDGVPAIRIEDWYAHARFVKRGYYGVGRNRFSLWEFIDGPMAGYTTVLWEVPLGKITCDEYILEFGVDLGLAWAAWPTTGPVEVTPENDLEYICYICGSKLGTGGDVKYLPDDVRCQSCEAAYDAMEVELAAQLKLPSRHQLTDEMRERLFR